MKIPAMNPLKHRSALATVMAVLLIFFAAAALAATAEHGDAAEAGGHGEAAAHGKGWVATDTYRVMNFAVLAVGLFLLLRKPVANALNARITGIRQQLEDLELQKKEAEKKLAEYNDKLGKLDQEAETIIAEYVRQGEEAKIRILKEAEQTAEKLEEQARRNIEAEFETAKKKLKAEIVEKSLVKAEQIIRERVNEEDQDRLVDEFLEKVVA